MSLARAYAKHAKALAAFGEAHRTLAEDRNHKAGEVSKPRRRSGTIKGKALTSAP